jgi:hypothetical protein
MNRRAIAVVIAAAMALMTFPGTATAHESSAADLNDVAYDRVWPLIGPGGVTDDPALNDALSAAGLDAQEKGGNAGDDAPDARDSCTHHDDGQPDQEPALDNECDDGDVQSMKFYQCKGSSELGSMEEADIEVETPMPFFHSDLENGVFEATGSFFVPIEPSGDLAGEVDQVWFGFAHTFAWPLSSALCQEPFPAPGAYYEFYRGDTDGEPWEIPVNTLLVPDAPYGAILRLMDSSGNTLAAAFVYSNVNNYLNDANFQPGTPTTCDQEGDTGGTLCPYHDVTPPRATVFDETQHDDKFPRFDDNDNADGTSDTGCARGIALEYGEPLAEDGNGKPAIETSENWYEYNPPDRDVDSVPVETTARDNWGPGICIPFPSESFTVKAWDQTGNVGTQHITVGS